MNQPVEPNTPFTITLEAQQWNAVLGAMSEAPYRIAAPLVQAISQQLQSQAPGATMPAPNGHDAVSPP